MERQTFRYSACNRCNVDILIALVVTCESDPLTIGGNAGMHFLALKTGNAGRFAAPKRRLPNVSGVSEYQGIARQVRLPQQLYVTRKYQF